ncbi:MAG: helix-turn-helix transcriptional regulator [Gemmatimonadaceae bacterium]
MPRPPASTSAPARRSQRATPKVQRWIDILAALLRHHFGLTLEQLVREVPAYAATSAGDARARMFERDKKELRALGVPIVTSGTDDGESARYRLRTADFYLPYLTVVGPAGRSGARHVDRDGYRALQTLAFEPDELAVVIEAGERARQLGDPALSADAASALRKLAFDLPVDSATAAGDTVIARPRAAADPAALVALGEALRARKRVEFQYHAMTSDATTHRAVEPYGLFFLGGHWYLTGRDSQRDALRNFRVSRISEVAMNRKQPGTHDYAVPDDFVLADHARSRQAWELGDGDAVDAVVAFTGTTGAVNAAARLGAPVAGEPTSRRFVVRRSDVFARWLLSLGGAARPLAPATLVEEYGALAAATLRRYRDAARETVA